MRYKRVPNLVLNVLSQYNWLEDYQSEDLIIACTDRETMGPMPMAAFEFYGALWIRPPI